jgi:hypothetical protein
MMPARKSRAWLISRLGCTFAVGAIELQAKSSGVALTVPQLKTPIIILFAVAVLLGIAIGLLAIALLQG